MVREGHVGASHRLIYRDLRGSNVAGVSSVIYHIATRADWERAVKDGLVCRSGKGSPASGVKRTRSMGGRGGGGEV